MSTRVDQTIILVDDTDDTTLSVARERVEWTVKPSTSTHLLVSAEDLRAFAQLILDTVPEP